MTDPRKGLPSASNIESLYLCPGKLNAERGLPEIQSEDSISGDRIHAALAGDNDAFLKLTADEQETYELCHRLAEEIAHAHLGEYEKCLKEQRLWLTNGDGDKVLSGQFDRLYLSKDAATLVDFKTGRGEVAEAAGNWQLMTLAVLVGQTYSPDKIICAIIQPWVRPQVSVVEYDIRTIKLAYERLMDVLLEIRKPDAPRNPGEKQCHYCKARTTCPESVGMAVTTIDAFKSDSLSKLTVAQIFDRLKFIEKWGKDFIEDLKAKVQANPENYPEFRLKSGATINEITNPTEVFKRAHEAGISQQQFLDCLKVRTGDLKEVIKATGKKGKEIDSLYQQLTEGCTTQKQNAPSLERVK